MVALGCAIGAELAAVALSPVLRRVYVDARARCSGAGSEAGETVRPHDLEQCTCRRRGEVSDNLVLAGPVPDDPVSVRPLEPRDSACVRRDAVQDLDRLRLVGRLEDPSHAVAQGLDL